MENKNVQKTDRSELRQSRKWMDEMAEMATAEM